MNTEQRFLTTCLSEYLRARGVKQRWLADQVGVHEMQVSRWVRGISPISDEHAARVALVLGVPRSFLFTVPFGTKTVTEERLSA